MFTNTLRGGNGRPREKDMQAQKVTRRAYGWPDVDDEARPRGMRLGKYTLRMLRHLQDPRGCHLRASVYGVCLSASCLRPNIV